MTPTQKKIQELTEAGHEPFSYSGRGMFGKYCVAISADRGEIPEGAAGASTDSLGRSTVYYWPRLTWEDE